MFIPVPKVAQLEFISSIDGQRIENVLHYAKAAPETDYDVDDLTLLVAAGITKWKTNVQPLFSSACSLVEVIATDLSSQTGPKVQSTSGLPQAGGQAATFIPNNVACVFTKRTALRGRSYRGRIYSGGWATASFLGNKLQTATLAAALTQYNSMKTILDGGATTHNMVVVSRYNNGIVRTSGTFEVVTEVTSDGTADSQRRRLPGRGA